MSLKARLEKLETKANPQDDKDLCVFIVTAFGKLMMNACLKNEQVKDNDFRY